VKELISTLRRNVVILLFVACLPLASQPQNGTEFSLEQLTGKGNNEISGSGYTSTMHRKTAQALTKMKTAALKDGIRIEVVSAYRSFQRQKVIYERKYRSYLSQGLSPTEAIEKVIEYSTIPGTSRHHWGTDLDLIDGNAERPKNVLDPKNYEGDGPYCALKEWLTKNAHRFGFYEVYTQDPKRKGFKYEPWHYSYAPVSVPMLRAYKKLDLETLLKNEKLAGSAYFTPEFVARYRRDHILDINPGLK